MRHVATREARALIWESEALEEERLGTGRERLVGAGGRWAGRPSWALEARGLPAAGKGMRPL